MAPTDEFLETGDKDASSSSNACGDDFMSQGSTKHACICGVCCWRADAPECGKFLDARIAGCSAATQTRRLQLMLPALRQERQHQREDSEDLRQTIVAVCKRLADAKDDEEAKTGEAAAANEASSKATTRQRVKGSSSSSSGSGSALAAVSPAGRCFESGFLLEAAPRLRNAAHTQGALARESAFPAAQRAEDVQTRAAAAAVDAGDYQVCELCVRCRSTAALTGNAMLPGCVSESTGGCMSSSEAPLLEALRALCSTGAASEKRKAVAEQALRIQDHEMMAFRGVFAFRAQNFAEAAYCLLLVLQAAARHMQQHDDTHAEASQTHSANQSSSCSSILNTYTGGCSLFSCEDLTVYTVLALLAAPEEKLRAEGIELVPSLRFLKCHAWTPMQQLLQVVEMCDFAQQWEGIRRASPASPFPRCHNAAFCICQKAAFRKQLSKSLPSTEVPPRQGRKGRVHLLLPLWYLLQLLFATDFVLQSVQTPLAAALRRQLILRATEGFSRMRLSSLQEALSLDSHGACRLPASFSPPAQLFLMLLSLQDSRSQLACSRSKGGCLYPLSRVLPFAVRCAAAPVLTPAAAASSSEHLTCMRAASAAEHLLSAALQQILAECSAGGELPFFYDSKAQVLRRKEALADAHLLNVLEAALLVLLAFWLLQRKARVACERAAAIFSRKEANVEEA
ncbi:hypothetical protein cyc_02312 [Cyclospora cayetanensis]|uniref:Transmembrane protein n=1 Tax=Cyclospora cayetanensis TaxID=88456 RepID=A0A1D3D5H9_9EIME|nr:hypothetical protein cyc_02312 [Cyclospora cayetanensis]